MAARRSRATGTYGFDTTVHPGAAVTKLKSPSTKAGTRTTGRAVCRTAPTFRFTVPFTGAQVSFRYNPTTHLLTIMRRTQPRQQRRVQRPRPQFAGHSSTASLGGAVNPEHARHIALPHLPQRRYRRARALLRHQLPARASPSRICRSPPRASAATTPRSATTPATYWQTTVYTPTAAHHALLSLHRHRRHGHRLLRRRQLQRRRLGRRPRPTWSTTATPSRSIDSGFQPITWMQERGYLPDIPRPLPQRPIQQRPDGHRAALRLPVQPARPDHQASSGPRCRKAIARTTSTPARPARKVPRGRDYFGGDLKGVDQELGYLQSLGVNTSSTSTPSSIRPRTTATTPRTTSTSTPSSAHRRTGRTWHAHARPGAACTSSLTACSTTSRPTAHTSTATITIATVSARAKASARPTARGSTSRIRRAVPCAGPERAEHHDLHRLVRLRQPTCA